MPPNKLPRGMGSFFKDCACAKPTKCPHEYTIRYRNGAGKQTEESGYASQTDAINRLTEIYNEKRSGSAQVAVLEKLELGRKSFQTYAEEYIARRRDWGTSRLIGFRSALNAHLYPHLASRRIETFTPSVVDSFIETMTRNDVGLGAQTQAFIALKSVLHDAHRREAIRRDPLQGVVAPQYEPERAVIPTWEQVQSVRESMQDLRFRLVVDVMVGMGLRNGEALALNINNLVADDVYRITEQVSAKTNQLTPLKHRKKDEFREVPMPRSVRKKIQAFHDEYGALPSGYLLRGANRTGKSPFISYRSLNNAWGKATKDLELPDGLVMYGLRHYFASNCLSKNIPITDVAEWMGHKRIEVTYRHYRHLMPSAISRAAEVLETGLAEAA